MGVMRHVKMRYNTKEDAVKFISEYALNPQESKAVCMPQKIKRFGLMPSQKENVSKEELQTIATWMYDNFPPKGFQGMGRGQGQGKGCQSH
jgi:cytochrome c